MSKQEVGGQLLGGSGWEAMFHMAGIFPPGVCNSLLDGKKVKRTTLAYQLTLCWIHILLQDAYGDYLSSSISPHEPYSIWEECTKKSCPTFKYLTWITCREYILLNSRFIRGQRSGDCMAADSGLLEANNPLAVCLQQDQLCLLDACLHTVRDMLLLERRHPLVQRAF